MCGNTRLLVHLNILFNMFIAHCHTPTLFMQSVIVPLIKCKGGDLTDINNYRAIAISKIFETILLNKVTSVSACDKHQFGFKAGHSTGHCTNAVKKAMEYYTDHGSHVFACFVYFIKHLIRLNIGSFLINF
jgi:hypothetical protein